MRSTGDSVKIIMKSCASEASIKRHSGTKASQKPATLLLELHTRSSRVTGGPIHPTVTGQLHGDKGRKRAGKNAEQVVQVRIEGGTQKLIRAAGKETALGEPLPKRRKNIFGVIIGFMLSVLITIPCP